VPEVADRLEFLPQERRVRRDQRALHQPVLRAFGAVEPLTRTVRMPRVEEGMHQAKRPRRRRVFVCICLPVRHSKHTLLMMSPVYSPPCCQGRLAMESDLVEREERGPVSLLTMVYGPYNLLGPKLMGALAAQLSAACDAGSRAIVLRSGLRHFCAGADVSLFGGRIEQGGRSRAEIGGVDFLKLLELLPVPIVPSVHGVCLGGGFELALACDYIVAANSAKIGSVESALGLHPLLGGIQRQVQRAGAMRAKEMSMLGRPYAQATLERWGLVNLVVP